MGLVLLFGTAYNLRDFRPSADLGGAAQAVPYKTLVRTNIVRVPIIKEHLQDLII